MAPEFAPARSDAIRVALIEEVSATPARRHHRPLLTIALLTTGALIGAGASTAALAAVGGFVAPVVEQPAGEPQPEYTDAVQAPPGTEPGAPVISVIGSPTSLSVSEAVAHSLADRPDGTTHVRVTITALSSGSVNWGTDAGGNNPTASFGPGDLGTRGDTTWYDFPLDATTDVFYVTPYDGFTAAVSIQFLNETPTRLRENADGQTYGVEGGPDGTPELVRVSGTAPDGSIVEGYALAVDLAAFSPDHPEQPADPEEALAWQKERDDKYPTGWDIPMFKSDGTTRIGTFHVG